MEQAEPHSQKMSVSDFSCPNAVGKIMSQVFSSQACGLFWGVFLSGNICCSHVKEQLFYK